MPKAVKGIDCSATVPDVWLTLYRNGNLRIHARMVYPRKDGDPPYRVLNTRLTKTDRAVIRRLIGKINLTAMGEMGSGCSQRDCFASANVVRA